MHLGVAMFFTDYSMTPQELAVAAEQRGFDSVWSPEHSHIPMSAASRPSRRAASCRRNTTTPWTRSWR